MREEKGTHTKVEGMITKHYWRAVTSLLILILLGSVFWGLRRFYPTLFLGKPDLIAVPNEEINSQKPDQSKIEVEQPQRPAVLNINTASVEDLQTLPNIGPQMAKRIVQYRNENGNFDKVDALTDVRGIGEKTLEKLKPYVGVE